VSRALTAAVTLALALPIVALAALIGEQELRFADVRIVNVPIRGYDPRDLLRGHYLVGRFDWNWDVRPAKDGAGGLCVPDGDASRARVRFLADWHPGDRAEGCRLVIAGRIVSGVAAAPPTFVPASLDSGSRGVRFYVSEARAPDLEELIRAHPGALTADLAVRADGGAAIKALRIDGQVVGR